MFGLGFWELVAVGVVLVVFVRPEQIPTVLRKLGRFYGKVTSMTRQAQEQISRLSEVPDVHGPEHSILDGTADSPQPGDNGNSGQGGSHVRSS